MKVTQQSEPKFIPVVITLESQEEGRRFGIGKDHIIVSTC